MFNLLGFHDKLLINNRSLGRRIWKKAWFAVELMAHKILLSAKTEHKKSTQLLNDKNALCSEWQVARDLILILVGHFFNYLGMWYKVWNEQVVSRMQWQCSRAYVSLANVRNWQHSGSELCLGLQGLSGFTNQMAQDNLNKGATDGCWTGQPFQSFTFHTKPPLSWLSFNAR